MFSSFASKRAFALAAGLVLGVSAGLFPSPALAAKPAGGTAKAAKQPIAMGVISGPQGPKVRERVLKVLKNSDLYEVTDAEDLKPTDKPATFASTANALQVDAVIVGTVTKRMTLMLSVYGANGAKIDTLELPGGSFPKLYKAVDNELEIAIADPLASAKTKGGNKAAAAAAAAPAAAPEPAPKGDADIEMTETPAEKPKSEKPKKETPKAAAAATAKGKKSAKPEVEEPAAEEEEEETAPLEESDPDEEESAAEPSAPSEKGRRPVEAVLGMRLYNRKFNYTDSADPLLHSYSLDVAPALVVAARVYPGAFFRNDILSHVGVLFRWELGIPTTTQYPRADGSVAELKTKTGEFQLGVRGRFPIGAHELGTSLAYGSHWFKLKGDETFGGDPYAVVPDVDYRYVRASIDGRIYLKKLVVGAHLAPRFVTSLHELDLAGVWFPGAHGSGLDFGVMGGWKFLPWLSAVGGIDVVRYGFDFNNTPAPNRVVAGGATDTYLSLWLGAMFHLDGNANVEGGSIGASTE
ncbi:MAG TPA: hypothetical protein VGK73_27085 [Polyangiaceae bacterium]